MKKFLAVIIGLIGLLNNLLAQNITGQIVDGDNTPISGATCLLLNLPDSAQVAGTTTNVNGVFDIKASKGKEYILQISFLGFETYTSNIALNESIDMGQITLSEKAHTLDDVVITAQMVDRFSDRKEYKLTNADKEQYSSALSALEFLPKIQVMDQSVSSVDGKSVKILINGVPSTATDLSIISPSNIAKIDYYTQPPV